MQARTGILRSPLNDLLAAEAEEAIGSIAGQIGRFGLEVRGDHLEEISPDLVGDFTRRRESLLEINNDQYPTATFQRRVVELPGVSEAWALAMEEDMSVIDLKPRGSKKEATVAAIKGPDRFNALDRVLAATDFFSCLEHARAGSGKSREEFSIIVKPSLSFMYSLTDISTFTDPMLVEHLVDRRLDSLSVTSLHSAKKFRRV